MQVKVRMQLQRTTPGTGLYKEVDSRGYVLSNYDAEIGQLYLKKKHFQGQMPQDITVTLIAE